MKTSNSYIHLKSQLEETRKIFNGKDVLWLVNEFIRRYEEETKPDNSGKWLLDHLFICTKIRRKAINKSKLKERLKTFSIAEIRLAILNASKSPHHIDNGFRHMTAEFFTRNDSIIDKWLNVKQVNGAPTMSLKDSIQNRPR